MQNSEWYNDDETKLAPLFRALAPILCPSCDPDNPYDNPYLYENYPPNQEAGEVGVVAGGSSDTSTFSLFAAAPGEVAANTGSLSGDEKSETADPVTSAVTGLRRSSSLPRRLRSPPPKA